MWQKKCTHTSQLKKPTNIPYIRWQHLITCINTQQLFKPNQTKPNQTKPNQTKLNQIKSNETKSNQNFRNLLLPQPGRKVGLIRYHSLQINDIFWSLIHSYLLIRNYTLLKMFLRHHENLWRFQYLSVFSKSLLFN